MHGIENALDGLGLGLLAVPPLVMLTAVALGLWVYALVTRRRRRQSAGVVPAGVSRQPKRIPSSGSRSGRE